MIRQLFLLSSLILFPCTAVADGLLYNLPAEGSWVRYDWDGSATKADGTPITVSGTFTLSSVGTVEKEGRKCCWIETVMAVKSEGHELTNAYKLLIPAEDLGKGKNPLKGVIKAWHRNSLSSKQPVEIPDASATGAPTLHLVLTPFLHGPFANQTEQAATKVKCPLGTFDCKIMIATEKIERDEGVAVNSDYRIAISDKVPFGVAEWEHKLERKKQDKPDLKSVTRLKLAALGVDAKSTMPDSQ